MTEHERMACDAIIAEAYKGIADLEDELATMRAENESLKRDLWTVFEHAKMYLPHLKEGFSVYDIAKEALK